MYAVSWGDPDIVRQELTSGRTSLTSDDLSHALQKALVSAMRDRTPKTLSCVSILMEAGAELSSIAFNALCEPHLGRYVEVPLHELELKLLSKLQLASLASLDKSKLTPNTLRNAAKSKLTLSALSKLSVSHSSDRSTRARSLSDGSSPTALAATAQMQRSASSKTDTSSRSEHERVR